MAWKLNIINYTIINFPFLTWKFLAKIEKLAIILEINRGVEQLGSSSGS